MSALIIGLSGRRGTGKSVVARHLVEEHGFTRLHPFDGGKAACVGYFRHLGATEAEAWEMVNGGLKDEPCALLPSRQTPRFFMEKFGQFMGVQLGPDWTIGAEMRRAINAHPEGRFVIESIVYEADTLREFGASIITVNRSGASIEGIETDKVVASIVPDFVLENSGTIADLKFGVDDIIERLRQPRFEMA